MTGALASGYVMGKVLVPIYRLPLFSRETLPGLLADGKLDGPEAVALMHFFVDADSFNRSLDLGSMHRADIARDSTGTAKAMADKEGGRAMKKARRLVPGGERHENALAVLAKHMPAGTLERLGLASGSRLPIQEQEARFVAALERAFEEDDSELGE